MQIEPVAYAPPPAVATAFARAGGGRRDSDPVFKKIRKQNGEQFAQILRNHRLLEIPDIETIVSFAGRDAAKLLPYLMTLLPSNDDTPAPKAGPAQDPFALLKQAGYTAFLADSLDKKNSIKKYFSSGELLCTFNDSARHKGYYIIHAVKDNADAIKRADFDGQEQRQDAYGTSVISIQICKGGGFIKITNRYNHKVTNPDNTFNSNPDNIIEGLSDALKAYFDVDFTASKVPLPEGYVLNGNQIFKYHFEKNNIFYGDQSWLHNGTIHTANREAGEALFGEFLFVNTSENENERKTLKKIDPDSKDSFADDFNRDYGGNTALRVDKQGNLCQNDEVLIGATQSRIQTICLPKLKKLSSYSLNQMPDLTDFEANSVEIINAYSLNKAPSLKSLKIRSVKKIESRSARDISQLKSFEAPELEETGDFFMQHCQQLASFKAPKLKKMGISCVSKADSLVECQINSLQSIGNRCFHSLESLVHLDAPALEKMGRECFRYLFELVSLNAPKLKEMDDYSFSDCHKLKEVKANALEGMGLNCFHVIPHLKVFETHALKQAPLRLAHLSKNATRMQKLISMFRF